MAENTAPTYLNEMSLDDLWERRDALKAEARALQTHITYLEMEVIRRAREAHPDVDVEDGGTIQVAGERIVVSYSVGRHYEYDAYLLSVAKASMLPAEWEQLVPRLEPVVSGTVFNSLVKRGGALAADLLAARKVTSRSPRLSVKPR